MSAVVLRPIWYRRPAVPDTIASPPTAEPARRVDPV
jgi:hypothetical protein